MQSFAKYATDRWTEDSLEEAFGREEIGAFQPENGQWVPPLDESASEHVFHYSVPSDPKKWCNSRYNGIPCNELGPEEREMNGCLPCYEVHIGGGYISFKHKHTGYSDRFDQNRSVARSGGGEAMGVATEQMYSVLYAVGQYIQRWHPDRLNWSPIDKTRTGARNRGARSKVYFLWMAKNLYPEYVPIRDAEWVRADLYKTLYPAQDGYPDPDKAAEIGNAKKFLETHEKTNETASRNREERMQRERQQRMATLLSDPQFNPNGIQLHDIVMVKGRPSSGSPHPSAGSTEGMLYTVFGVDVDTYGDYGERGGLYVDLDPYRQTGDEYPHNRFSGPVALSIKQVVKADESLLGQRRDRIRSMQQQHNPHGMQPGDLVVVPNEEWAGRSVLGRIEFIRLRGGEPMAMIRLSRTGLTQWEPLNRIRPARGDEIDDLS